MISWQHGVRTRLAGPGSILANSRVQKPIVRHFVECRGTRTTVCRRAAGGHDFLHLPVHNKEHVIFRPLDSVFVILRRPSLWSLGISTVRSTAVAAAIAGPMVRAMVLTIPVDHLHDVNFTPH